jgi:iron complex outermembrane recepter protein
MAALAQEMEQIVSNGIRGSLSAAADIKRVSTVIQDSISCEDRGTFPDSNVAESLQRIPGLSIDRDGGEGRFVTVRGFGPEFNTVLSADTLSRATQPAENSVSTSAAELGGADVYNSATSMASKGSCRWKVSTKT